MMSAAFRYFSAACCALKEATHGSTSSRAPSAFLDVARSDLARRNQPRATSATASGSGIDRHAFVQSRLDESPDYIAIARGVARRRHEDVLRDRDVGEHHPNGTQELAAITTVRNDYEEIDVAVTCCIAASLRAEHDNALRVEAVNDSAFDDREPAFGIRAELQRTPRRPSNVPPLPLAVGLQVRPRPESTSGQGRDRFREVLPTGPVTDKVGWPDAIECGSFFRAHQVLSCTLAHVINDNAVINGVTGFTRGPWRATPRARG